MLPIPPYTIDWLIMEIAIGTILGLTIANTWLLCKLLKKLKDGGE